MIIGPILNTHRLLLLVITHQYEFNQASVQNSSAASQNRARGLSVVRRRAWQSVFALSVEETTLTSCYMPTYPIIWVTAFSVCKLPGRVNKLGKFLIFGLAQSIALSLASTRLNKKGSKIDDNFRIQSPSAQSTAACACSKVVGKIGTGQCACLMSNSISVQPNIMPSAPELMSCAITSIYCSRDVS